MTTFREQAREAATEGRGSVTWSTAKIAADAASDVWAPLVAELLDALEAEVRFGRENPDTWPDLRRRANEALGRPR